MNKIEITDLLFKQLIKFNDRISEVNNNELVREKIYLKYGHRLIEELDMRSMEFKYYIGGGQNDK